jgi:hypothetical protein
MVRPHLRPAAGLGAGAESTESVWPPFGVAPSGSRYPIKDLNFKSFFCSPETPRDGLKIAKKPRVSVLFRWVKFLTHV